MCHGNQSDKAKDWEGQREISFAVSMIRESISIGISISILVNRKYVLVWRGRANSSMDEYLATDEHSDMDRVWCACASRENPR